MSAQHRYVVPDVPEALKQRIQREAFICNELTIREEEPSLDDEEQEEDIIVEEDLLWASKDTNSIVDSQKCKKIHLYNYSFY